MKNRIKEILDTPTCGDSARMLAIVSGKGGVGKSVITYNLASALAQTARVLVIDGDFQMGNQHILANENPQYGLIDACLTEMTLREVITKTENGPDLIAGSGEFSEGLLPDFQNLAQNLSGIRESLSEYDFILFDTASGILPHTNLILNAVDEVVLVMTPELTAISNSYALHKILIKNNSELIVSLLINRSGSDKVRDDIYRKFIDITSKFLNSSPALFGGLEISRELMESVARQMSVIAIAPESPISDQFTRLAHALTHQSSDKNFQRKSLSFTPVGADIKE